MSVCVEVEGDTREARADKIGCKVSILKVIMVRSDLGGFQVVESIEGGRMRKGKVSRTQERSQNVK